MRITPYPVIREPGSTPKIVTGDKWLFTGSRFDLSEYVYAYVGVGIDFLRVIELVEHV